MPASVIETMKYGPPRSPKLREQMASATHNVTPRSVHSPGWRDLHSSPVPVAQLCSHVLPLFQPARGAGRPCRSQTQLRCQASEVVSHINVVKGICETYGKLEISCARQESLQRAVGAHSVAVRKAQNEKPSPRRDSSLRRAVGPTTTSCAASVSNAPSRTRRRQVGAVAVEGNRTPLMAVREVCKYRREARS